LICDEWGYIPLDKERSQLLFQIVSECYEKRSVIITTNLEFSKWDGIFYKVLAKNNSRLMSVNNNGVDYIIMFKL